MINFFHSNLVLVSQRWRALLLAALLASGCAQPSRPQPSLRVVDAAVVAQSEVGGMPPVPTPTLKLYRDAQGWFAFDEVSRRSWRVSARAEKMLLSAQESEVPPTLAPAPLPQEWAEELARLKKLAAQNQQAMEQMEQSSRGLSDAAREMLRRSEALSETVQRARPTPVPSPLPREVERPRS